ncbi:MFS transporter [Rhodococcus opacus]|uniref:MFS transporter n=1 Tax=Rhodococcus opacus TaxID=37919 RepID=UPI00155AB413|nr:MFS transporter [Rhodococcus opacus]
MAPTREVDISQLIDAAPVSALQKRAIALCLALAILDGMDAQLIGFAIPALSEDWGLSKASFGLLLALSSGAMVVGSLLFGPVADRWGRRRVILLCTVLFAVFTLASAFAPSMGVLIVLRILAGIGLGGVTPNLIALTSEYSPARSRSTLVTIVVAGMSLGGFLGGLAAAQLIPAYGWQSIFVAGGVLPLIVAALAWAGLPESGKFLASRGDHAGAAKILSAIAPHAGITGSVTFTVDAAVATKSPIRELFAGGRALDTVLLWVVFVINFLVIYFLFGWMPSLFSQAGQSASHAILAAALFNLGGMAGALSIGWITDRVGTAWRRSRGADAAYAVVMAGYTLGALFIGVVAMFLANSTLLLTTICIVGFGMSGSSAGIIAIAASIYPVAARSTGIGWAMGIGRIGSIAGPTLGAALIAAGMDARTIFLLMIVPTAVAFLTLGALFVRERLRVRTVVGAAESTAVTAEAH